MQDSTIPFSVQSICISKNADIKNHVIIDANGKEHDIAPDEIQVWHTGMLVCVDTSKLTLSESETTAVRL